MATHANDSQDVPAWLALVRRQWEERSQDQQAAWAVHQSAVGMQAALRARPAGVEIARDLATKWANVAMVLAKQDHM